MANKISDQHKMPGSHDDLMRIRWLSRFLDSSIRIPGTNFKFGLDPLIGLIPGIGDGLSAALSSYIIILALQLNVSRWTLTRMLFNVLLDSIIGAIPVVGDVFDAVWKSNERNRRLIEESLKSPQRKKLDRGYVILVLIVLVVFVSFAVWLAMNVLGWIIAYMRNLPA